MEQQNGVGEEINEPSYQEASVFYIPTKSPTEIFWWNWCIW
jgi:hypothetical protein